MNPTDTALELAGIGASAELERDGEAARDFGRERLSPATRRAYQADVEVFVAWCRERGVRPLPAEPEVVAAFLAHEAERGLRASTMPAERQGSLARSSLPGLVLPQR